MIEIGRIYKLKIKVTKKRINLFKDLTLDKNIIHADSNAAKKIGLKKPLVYGMLTSSFLSNIIGNKLPGKGAIWTGCDISFSKPVFENDLLNFNSKILKISKSTKTLVIDTEVFNQNNDLVMNAVSSVKYPESFSKKINYKNKKKKLIKKVKLKDLNVVIGASSDLGLEFAKKIQNKNSKLLLTYFNGEKKIKKSLKKNKNTFLKKLDLNSKKDLFKVKKFISKKYTIKSLVFTVSGPI